MRTYLELVEVLPEGSPEEPDFIRIDVTGWAEGDVEALIGLLEEHARKYGTCTIQRHFCRHEEGEACYVEVLGAVGT